MRCSTIIALASFVSLGFLLADEISLDLGDSEKMEFVWVPLPVGERKAFVQIGDFSAGHGFEPVREVAINGPFTNNGKEFGYYLGKNEVTEEQWNIVMNSGKKTKFPVTNKSYAQILTFIEELLPKARRSSSFPKTPDGKSGEVRLPTEAEWEYAARGGASAVSYQANDPYQGDFERYEVFAARGSGGQSREVATLLPNSLGLHDMLGNVREFVEGRYSEESGGGRLLKGGCFTSEKAEIRSSARTEQSERAAFAGFRLCISADIFTSLGQAQEAKERLKVDQETAAQAKSRKAEEAMQEERLKQMQDAKVEEWVEKRRSLDLAEKQANEEKARLKAPKKQLADGATPSTENATRAVEGAAPSAPTSSYDANKATKGFPYENSLGMKFVPVPGTYVLFSVWNTRVKDFRAYAEASGYRQTGGIHVWDGFKWILDANANWANPGFQQTGYHPVVGVSWLEAKAFCQWLTTKERGEGKITDSQEYRLPTDAEWSVAVGSGKYPWGNEWPPPKGAGNYDPSLGVDSYEYTSPCGNLSTNEFGLCDMGATCGSGPRTGTERA